MISYSLLWETMKQKGILLKDYQFSRGTLDFLKQGRNVTVATIDSLYKILDCKVEDILVYIKEDEI